MSPLTTKKMSRNEKVSLPKGKEKEKPTNDDGNLEINWFPYEKTHPTLFLFFSIQLLHFNE